MRGNRDDLTARCWSNLLVFEPATVGCVVELRVPRTKNKNATRAVQGEMAADSLGHI